MKKYILTLFAAGLIAAALPAAGDAAHTITTSGTGSVTAAADTATIFVSIETSSPDAKRAAEDNAAIASRVWNAVIAAGADADGLSTADYNLYPTYDGTRAKTAAYHVQNSIKVDVKDPKLAGAVSDAAVKAGATRISSVSFSLKDESPYRERALKLAAAAARQKADVIAEGLGCRIIGVESVQIGRVSSAVFNLREYAMADGIGNEAEPATELTPTQQEITGDVTVTFTIE